MIIKVTAKHIELGTRARCTQCPVALALRDTTGILWFITETDYHHIAGNFHDDGRYYLPWEVSQHIKNHDIELIDMIPFEFELDVMSYNHPVT